MRKIDPGNYHYCALSDNGVDCWFNSDVVSNYLLMPVVNVGQVDVPVLSNPTDISSGFSHSCAIDDEGVKCWGDDSYGQSSPPHFVNPLKVSAGMKSTCVLHQSGITCWGMWTAGNPSSGLSFTNLPDRDGDSIVNEIDNCPNTSNSNQLDTDNDNICLLYTSPSPRDS